MAAAPQETVERRETSTRSDYAPPATQARGGSGRATAALVLGIISIPAAIVAILGLVVGIIAIVLGATARSDLAGRGKATAGIVLGSVGVVLAIANMVAGVIAAS